MKIPRLNQRFATKCLIFIAIFLCVFTVLQYASFMITGMEQTQLIESVFTVIGLECGCLILKRICDVVFKKKKTQDEVPEFEDFPDMNNDGEDIAG